MNNVRRESSAAKQKWEDEKAKMQQTIIALSQEVEYLSTKNIQFLDDLK